jgi:hypothetical protein
VHVRPLEVQKDQRPDLLRPYFSEHNGARVCVVPRNRDVSNAQESGMDADWFRNEVLNKVRESPAPDEPRLVCTWSDGENGGWFRRLDEASGFWGHFFAPFVDQVRAGGPIRPVLISEFIDRYPPQELAYVKTGAWNVASTSGEDFSQWEGSAAQKQAVDELVRLSSRYWTLQEKVEQGSIREKLDQARKLILEAETSCFLFWGDSWVPKLYQRTGPAWDLLGQVEAKLDGRTP